MVEEGIGRNPESTKAQAQPGWRSAERPRCFLDLPTMVPAAASRTQPFIWLALSLTFIYLFDCVFYQLYLLVAGDPSKRYQTLLTISQFRRRAKKSYKGNLVATNPPGRYNIYLTIYWTPFFIKYHPLHTLSQTRNCPQYLS